MAGPRSVSPILGAAGIAARRVGAQGHQVDGDSVAGHRHEDLLRDLDPAGRWWLWPDQPEHAGPARGGASAAGHPVQERAAGRQWEPLAAPIVHACFLIPAPLARPLEQQGGSSPEPSRDVTVVLTRFGRCQPWLARKRRPRSASTRASAHADQGRHPPGQ
ncbi:hypothetical protein G6F65_016412 [Rhizopus arrhizus]|nr:hypothetical protein G6F65_016412 [Rhizopus arrhizus]